MEKGPADGGNVRRPGSGVKVENLLSTRMGAEAAEMDPAVSSYEERRLLVALEGQPGAERDDPQTQGRAEPLQEPEVAGELTGQPPPVGVSHPVAEDHGRYVVGNKWVHLPVPFCKTPV